MDAELASNQQPFEPLNEIVGNDTYEWRSQDGSLYCTFGRAKGIISLTVARVLGAAQSGNALLDFYYKAVAGIRSWNGVEVPQPYNEITFDAAMRRFGDDQNFIDYVNTWQAKLYPDAMAAIKDAIDAGMGPEAVGRIMENAGKQTAKKSQSRTSSRKS